MKTKIFTFLQHRKAHRGNNLKTSSGSWGRPNEHGCHSHITAVRNTLKKLQKKACVQPHKNTPASCAQKNPIIILKPINQPSRERLDFQANIEKQTRPSPKKENMSEKRQVNLKVLKFPAPEGTNVILKEVQDSVPTNSQKHNKKAVRQEINDTKPQETLYDHEIKTTNEKKVSRKKLPLSLIKRNHRMYLLYQLITGKRQANTVCSNIDEAPRGYGITMPKTPTSSGKDESQPKISDLFGSQPRESQDSQDDIELSQSQGNFKIKSAVRQKAKVGKNKSMSKYEQRTKKELSLADTYIPKSGQKTPGDKRIPRRESSSSRSKKKPDQRNSLEKLTLALQSTPASKGKMPLSQLSKIIRTRKMKIKYLKPLLKIDAADSNKIINNHSNLTTIFKQYTFTENWRDSPPMIDDSLVGNEGPQMDDNEVSALLKTPEPDQPKALNEAEIQENAGSAARQLTYGPGYQDDSEDSDGGWSYKAPPKKTEKSYGQAKEASYQRFIKIGMNKPSAPRDMTWELFKSIRDRLIDRAIRHSEKMNKPDLKTELIRYKDGALRLKPADGKLNAQHICAICIDKDQYKWHLKVLKAMQATQQRLDLEEDEQFFLITQNESDEYYNATFIVRDTVWCDKPDNKSESQLKNYMVPRVLDKMGFAEYSQEKEIKQFIILYNNAGKNQIPEGIKFKLKVWGSFATRLTNMDKATPRKVIHCGPVRVTYSINKTRINLEE